MPKPSLPKSPLPKSVRGFTLTEMLVTIVIGSLLVGLTANLISSHIRMIGTQQTLQRLHQRWIGINQLIRTDIQEGKSIRTSSTIPDACGGSGSTVLSIELPSDGDTDYYVHYYQRGSSGATDLWRCGPEVNADGSLGSVDSTSGSFTYNPTQNSRIARNASLTPLDADAGASQEVKYELSLSSPIGSRSVTYSATSAEATTGRSFLDTGQ